MTDDSDDDDEEEEEEEEDDDMEVRLPPRVTTRLDASFCRRMTWGRSTPPRLSPARVARVAFALITLLPRRWPRPASSPRTRKTMRARSHLSPRTTICMTTSFAICVKTPRGRCYPLPLPQRSREDEKPARTVRYISWSVVNCVFISVSALCCYHPCCRADCNLTVNVVLLLPSRHQKSDTAILHQMGASARAFHFETRLH